jgi:hypothetical protein
MLDLIARSEGLDRLRDVLKEARSLPQSVTARTDLIGPRTKRWQQADRQSLHDGCSRWRGRFRGPSGIRAIVVAPTAWARVVLVAPPDTRRGYIAAGFPCLVDVCSARRLNPPSTV